MHASRPVRARQASRARLALVLAAVSAASCDVPRFQGPQIQSPPPAFTMNRELTQERRMFPQRAVIYHDAWVEASWGNFSGIYINGHPGVLGRAEVEAALRSAVAATAGQRIEFGDIESLAVDGRTAWGWGETWRLDNGGLLYVVFRAAVPYDTITYGVDFVTGDPGLKIRPDSLRTVVASFAIGETTPNLPLIMIVAGVALLVLSLARSRAKARAERHRHVPLVKIPPKKAEGTAGAPAAAPGPPAAGTPPAGGAPPPAGTPPPAGAAPTVAEALRRQIEDRKGGDGAPGG